MRYTGSAWPVSSDDGTLWVSSVAAMLLQMDVIDTEIYQYAGVFEAIVWIGAMGRWTIVMTTGFSNGVMSVSAHASSTTAAREYSAAKFRLTGCGYIAKQAEAR